MAPGRRESRRNLLRGGAESQIVSRVGIIVFGYRETSALPSTRGTWNLVLPVGAGGRVLKKITFYLLLKLTLTLRNTEPKHLPSFLPSLPSFDSASIFIRRGFFSFLFLRAYYSSVTLNNGLSRY